LAARRWIEARLKATNLIAATRKGLVDAAGDLTADYRMQVEAAQRELEDAAATVNLETGAGDTQRLQAACAALDEATKPLAELLMDRAMEAMLRKKGLIE
jgi:hypothetical protein